MKKNLFLFFASLLSILGSTEVFAQYKVGDYYVNGDIKGIVFFVNNDEGTLALLKTDMEGRYESYGIGDYIEWRELEFIIQNANRNYPYDVWDIPNSRFARLIHQNAAILCEKSVALGYKILPIEAFMNARVTSDGVQRLIPVFWPRSRSADIFDTKAEALLLDGERGDTGVLLYGIVDYRTGEMRPLNQ